MKMLGLSMRTRSFLYWPAFCLAFFSPSLFAYQFENADAGQVTAMVAASLQSLEKGRASDIVAINERFSQLDRGQINLEDLVELKYELSHYRAMIVKVETSRMAMATPAEKEAILEDLENVGGYIGLTDATQILAAAGEDEALKKHAFRCLAKHGDLLTVRPLIAKSGDEEANLLAGPKKMLKYNEASHTDEDADKWLGKTGLDLTNFRSPAPYTIEYRGLQIRTGDMLIIDQGKTGGINTNFSDPRSYATHMGVVVFVQKQDKIYPSFFEIAERGIRVIPLNVAVSAPFTLYAEVYRPMGIIQDSQSPEFSAWAKKFGDDVLEKLKLEYTYDYYNPKIVTGQERGVVCSSLSQAILIANGVECQLKPDTIVEPAVTSLKTQLDFPLSEYVTPTSFLEAGQSKFAYVGTIETGLTSLNTVRELVIGSHGEVSPESDGYLFSHYPLDLKKLEDSNLGPKFKTLQLMAPGLIAMKLYYVNAPVKVLALAKMLDIPNSQAVDYFMRNYDTLIEAPVTFTPFSLHDKALEAGTREGLKTNLAVMRSWFRTE